MDPGQEPGWRHLRTTQGRQVAGQEQSAAGGGDPANGPPAPTLPTASQRGGRRSFAAARGGFFSCFLSVSELVIRGLITDNKLTEIPQKSVNWFCPQLLNPI